MPAGAGADGERVLPIDYGRGLLMIEDLDIVFLVDHVLVRNGPHQADLLPMTEVSRDEIALRDHIVMKKPADLLPVLVRRGPHHGQFKYTDHKRGGHIAEG